MSLIKITVSLFSCLIFFGCAFSVTDRENPYGAVNYQSDHINLAIYPKYDSIAVLPFENQSKFKTAPIQARRMFLGNFAATKSYDIQSIRETDYLLKQIQISSNELVKSNYKKLGKALGVDLLVFGRIIEYYHKYRVIYSQTFVKVVIVVVDSKTGKTVWWSEDSREQKYGGIGPYGLYVAHKNEYMWSRNILNRYDELFRDMMLVFPDKPLSKDEVKKERRKKIKEKIKKIEGKKK